jgi:hypothetical protein
MPISITGTGTITGLSAGGLPDLSITTDDIADSAITTAKIAAGAVIPADLSQPMTLGTAVASTSGTAVDFTGIPSWVKRITVMFNNVSTSGASAIQMQLGDVTSIETTGYLGATGYAGSAPVALRSTTGLLVSAVDAGTVTIGMAIITLVSGTSWVHQAVTGRSTTDYVNMAGGSKTLTGTLTRVRITTVNGTDTFDAGSINIMYEG